MLVVQSRHGAPVLDFSETLEDVSRNSTGSEVLRTLGYWLFYQRDPIGPTTSASLPYLVSLRTMLVSYLVVLVGLGGLAIVSWSQRRYAAMLIGAGIVLAVGVHPIDAPSPLMSMLTNDDRIRPGPRLAQQHPSRARTAPRRRPRRRRAGLGTPSRPLTTAIGWLTPRRVAIAAIACSPWSTCRSCASAASSTRPSIATRIRRRTGSTQPTGSTIVRAGSRVLAAPRSRVRQLSLGAHDRSTVRRPRIDPAGHPRSPPARFSSSDGSALRAR